MLATNEERREVARNLREYEYYGSPLWYHVAKAFDFPITMTARKFLDAVADLIEPEPERTCRNNSKVGSNSSGWLFDFKCSECGAELCAEEMGNSPLWVDGDAEQISYCPNCGAKVVK